MGKGESMNTYKCVSCGFFPLVFENDGTIKDAQEYEPHPITGEKYCFNCYSNKEVA